MHEHLFLHFFDISSIQHSRTGISPVQSGPITHSVKTTKQNCFQVRLVIEPVGPSGPVRLSQHCYK
ncbi:hypothetical protein Lalb_Chr01g0008821 [Lupinus albus]|uniref:Uncharacterized protein n=1 Tax=Lupinus albus TaxID=3870 RepID=A0A6A4R4K6_LUPAL|nr:hypothetical protein Lalb_Chr01g0008821 [Lupinus albus]